MTKSTNQLEVLFPQGKTLNIQNTELTIKPFKFGKIPAVFRALEPMADLFVQLATKTTSQTEILMVIISKGGTHLLDLVSIGSGQSKEWVEELNTDEGLELLTAIIEVNLDFFLQKILPMMTETLARLNKQTKKTVDGLTL